MEFKKVVQEVYKDLLKPGRVKSTARVHRFRMKNGLMENKKKIELLLNYGYKRIEYSIWISPITGDEIDTIEAIRECLTKLPVKWKGTYKYRLVRDKLSQDKIHEILISNNYKPLTQDEWVKSNINNDC